MSMLSSFVQNQLLKALEDAFISHEDDIKDLLIKEVEAFAQAALSWVEKKLLEKSQGQ